jgi:hypothetical protein
LLDHYLRVERPQNSAAALFVSLKGRSRGTRMTAAGLRSLFRYHRQTTGVTLANPQPFPTYLCLRYGASWRQSSRAHAVNGSRRHRDDAGLCPGDSA